MRGKVGGLSPPYFKSRGAIAPPSPPASAALAFGIAIHFQNRDWIVDPFRK